MAKILVAENRSKEILNKIKEDVKELSISNEKNNSDLENIINQVKNIHHELIEFEYSLKNQTELEKNTIAKNQNKDEMAISKKITIKKTKKSKSFRSWLFNNNEL